MEMDCHLDIGSFKLVPKERTERANVACAVRGRNLWLKSGFSCASCDPENHEFGRFQRRKSNQANQTAVIQITLSHGGAVAFNEERLFGLYAHQCARFQ